MKHQVPKGWEVKNGKSERFRPNKQSAGITESLFRHFTERREVIKLSLFGTLDSFAKVLTISIHSKCPCCGAMTGKFVLSRHGKYLLKKYREKYNSNGQNKELL